jgi:hypothetical protein
VLMQTDFEQLLNQACERLSSEIAAGARFEKSAEFENRVREVFDALLAGDPMKVDFQPHPHVFPDIVLGSFGVEVKFTEGDSWRSVANSILESRRGEQVEHVYILYGKMGGIPGVRWGQYGDCVCHVRTSHVPRFEVDMEPHESLFFKMGTTYEAFSHMPVEERMKSIRVYARSRLKQGERLWWLEDKEEPEHTLPIQARLYMTLPQAEKRKMRAEAAVLCPQIVKPSRAKNKYDDVTLYLLTYHGVLCPQARDLFSAGSVALRSDPTRGGNYILRALLDIQQEMLEAFGYLEDALFVEYWGTTVAPEQRVKEWLTRADSFADVWKPSDYLFIEPPALRGRSQ